MNYKQIYISQQIVATRMKKKLSQNIILEEQTAFVPGRSVLDVIIIIHETIHSAQDNKEEYMLVKLDIQKTYGMVYWKILCKTMETFVFSRQWVNLIFNCIATVKNIYTVKQYTGRFFQYFKRY